MQVYICYLRFSPFAVWLSGRRCIVFFLSTLLTTRIKRLHQVMRPFYICIGVGVLLREVRLLGSSLFQMFYLLYNFVHLYFRLLSIPMACISWNSKYFQHYHDVIIGAMTSQITGVSSVYSTFCSGENCRKHQSSMWLAFMRGNSPATGEFP